MAILQKDSQFTFSNVTATYDKLPVGVYHLLFDDRIGYYLNKKEDFKLPSKIYGDHSIVERWLTSYRTNDTKNLGIVLSGLKGTGKTITAQMLCNESKLPIILITDGFDGSDFVNFMSQPELNECVVFVDEYEKIYPSGYNSKVNVTDFLSLMDGNFKSHKIFLLTVNEFKINEFLINRPSRIKYRKIYEQLEYDVLEEVIEDLLINKNFKDSIIQFFNKLDFTTFDILISMINEINLFNEDAMSCAKYLNLELNTVNYNVFEIIDDKKFECSDVRFNLFNEDLKYQRYWIEDLKNDHPLIGKYEYQESLSMKELDISRVNDGFNIITPNNSLIHLRETNIMKLAF